MASVTPPWSVSVDAKMGDAEHESDEKGEKDERTRKMRGWRREAIVVGLLEMSFASSEAVRVCLLVDVTHSHERACGASVPW